MGLKNITISAKERDFLFHSNLIEDEHSITALVDAQNAWMHIRDCPLTKESILNAHSLLLRRLAPTIAGKIRNCSVMVGGRICPHPNKLNGLLSKWFDTYMDASTPKQIKIAHVSFEKIHPFQDGNGRIGRIIMNKQRLLAKLPIKIIHFEDRRKYYEWFREDPVEDQLMNFLHVSGVEDLPNLFPPI